MTVKELREMLHATNEELADILGRNADYVKHTLSNVEVSGRRHLLDGFLRLAELRVVQLAAALRTIAACAETMEQIPQSEVDSLRAIIQRCNLFIGGNGNGNGDDAARTADGDDPSPARLPSATGVTVR